MKPYPSDRLPVSPSSILPLGVTGNTPDSGSGESWFEPRRGNQSRSEVLRLFDCPSGLFAPCLRCGVEPRRGNSKRDADFIRVALLVFLALASVLQAFTPLPP